MKRPDELNDPTVVPIDDEFNRLLPDEQAKATGRAPRVQVRPPMDAAWSRRGHLTIGDALSVALAGQVGAALVTIAMKLARSPGPDVPTITPR